MRYQNCDKDKKENDIGGAATLWRVTVPVVIKVSAMSAFQRKNMIEAHIHLLLNGRLYKSYSKVNTRKNIRHSKIIK